MAAHLWSTGYSVSLSLKPVSTAPGSGAGRVVAGQPGRARCWVLRERAISVPRTGAFAANAAARAGTARILRTAQWTRASSVVAKLIRAHGGCLGTRSRRRTLEPAISPGESVTRH